MRGRRRTDTMNIFQYKRVYDRQEQAMDLSACWWSILPLAAKWYQKKPVSPMGGIAREIYAPSAGGLRKKRFHGGSRRFLHCKAFREPPISLQNLLAQHSGQGRKAWLADMSPKRQCRFVTLLYPAKPAAPRRNMRWCAAAAADRWLRHGLYVIAPWPLQRIRRLFFHLPQPDGGPSPQCPVRRDRSPRPMVVAVYLLLREPLRCSPALSDRRAMPAGNGPTPGLPYRRSTRFWVGSKREGLNNQRDQQSKARTRRDNFHFIDLHAFIGLAWRDAMT